jgi:uncharacterized protein YciI
VVAEHRGVKERIAGSERIYLVELVPTSARHERPDEFKRIVPAHLDWVAEQQRVGVLLATGPLVDEITGANTGHGIFLVRLASMEAAERWVAADPQVIAGFKTPSIRTWLMRSTFLP